MLIKGAAKRNSHEVYQRRRYRNVDWRFRANAVCPGFIVAESKRVLLDPKHKDILNELLARIPVGRIGEPDDIANAVCFLASDQFAFMTWTTLLIDGGITSSGNLPDIRGAFK